MEYLVKQRIKEIMEDKDTNPTRLSREFGVNQKTLNNQINSDIQLSASTILLITEAFKDISAEWLLRGEGEKFKCKIYNEKSNKISDISNNSGNVNNSRFDIAMSGGGNQKIINPDGSAEISQCAPGCNDELEQLRRENELLKFKLSALEDNMKIKDDLIASQKETIELLRHK